MKVLTNNRKNYDGKIKHVPAKFKVVKAHGNQPNHRFYDEDSGEDIVEES